MRTLLLTNLFLTSCAGNPAQRATLIDPILRPFIEQFEADMVSLGIKYELSDVRSIMISKDLPRGALASCNVHWRGNETAKFIIVHPVVVLQGKWDVIYHELGHCLFDLSHSPDPNSIMYAEDVHTAAWFNDNAEAALADFKQLIEN